MPARNRVETENDRLSIRRVNLRAFAGGGEADLVDALREQAAAFVSLVAEDANGVVVGHIAFSPVTLGSEVESPGCLGLGPMAVEPERQRRGIGAALVREGLRTCRAEGHRVVVVLGHPEYYPRFGFVPASRFGLACEYPAPDEAFMALELVPGALAGRAGPVRYHPAFGMI